MSNLVYPHLVHGLTFTVLKTPQFDTIVQAGPNGAEIRIPQTQNPIWNFTLVYDYLYDTFVSPNNTKPYAPYTDLQALMGFFLGRQGQCDDFLFVDPDDCIVGPALVSGQPNLQTQLAVVSDGNGNWYSPIQRNMGGFFSEDITDLNLTAAPLIVYSNGALKTANTDYTVGGPGLALPGSSYMGLYLHWAAQPVQPVTVSFSFYFRLRFATDNQDFEKWAAGLWTIGGSSSKNGSGMLKLRSSRPVLYSGQAPS